MNPIEIDLPTETRQRLETQARLRGKTVSELSAELIETGLRCCAESKPHITQESITPWLGSFRTSGRIIGDIVTPAIEESAWEVLKK